MYEMEGPHRLRQGAGWAPIARCRRLCAEPVSGAENLARAGLPPSVRRSRLLRAPGGAAARAVRTAPDAVPVAGDVRYF